jgi:hypothetical protein
MVDSSLIIGPNQERVQYPILAAESSHCMLGRWRLPRDNFPDDTESRAFQRYHSDSPRLPFWYGRRRYVGGLAIALAMLVGGIVLYLVLSNGEPTYVIVPGDTPADSPTPVATTDVLDVFDFLATVSEWQTTTIPARVDHSLATGASHAYVFDSQPDVEWCLSVAVDGLADLSVEFEHTAEDEVVTIDTDCAPGSYAVEQSVTFLGDGPYALVLRSGTTSGGYTFWLLPD